MNARFLITKFGCPHCREFIKATRLINLRLPIEKRIKIIDGWVWESYGVELEPLLSKFAKDGLAEGYPLCFITKEGITQGITLEPARPELLKAYLNEFLGDEFIY